MTHRQGDRLAFDRAMVTQPVWNRFDLARDATGIADNVLLHAGPPFPDPGEITRPILNSACVAAVYEGLAPSLDAAERMISSEEIILKPAQDVNVVTPLAAVVSASMPLHSVYDAWRGQHRTFAPINGGNRPALRLGLRSEAVLEHIRWLNTRCLDVLRGGLAEGIALVPLAVEGLKGGDDCHGRTPVAGAALVRELIDRSPNGVGDDETLEFLKGSPSVFLNLWMAATKLMMCRAEGVPGSGFVTAAGGNGRDVGIQVSAFPGRWYTVPATPPEGAFDVDLPPSRALGAIGDSAVVDAFGLGAMSDARAEPSTSTKSAHGMSVGEHPYFKGTGLKLGISAMTIAESGQAPRVSLGILDCKGEMGRLGGGLYQMPVMPFKQATEDILAGPQSSAG
ncbi:MAG: DUF1116 domain-containing protein [Boseongicola sp.]|nr:DUF1116 domain-containing protein [Boseongicola sp.]